MDKVETNTKSLTLDVCGDEPNTQKMMRKYWQERAFSWYSDYQLEDLKAINSQIVDFLPNHCLNVLDAGTGTGEVAASMAVLGNKVTGVDLCSNMIDAAKKAADRLGLDITYLVSPVDKLPFEDSVFDLVISRNLTWALSNPEDTFKEWRRVLKPGGMLIYWDGNYYLYHYDEKANEARKIIKEKSMKFHKGKSFDSSLCDDTAADLPLSKYDRPYEWDNKVLPNLGFEIIYESIFKPQNLIKFGIYDQGYCSNFQIIAKNGKIAE
ncbi:Methyltransferase domain-containing protein [Acetitomaculum ruminis DSM 5522]|uniref:Methyltransferase domain-containing protein n=1 Tax=Acetitomaculum ruminis DSM 5522 TaxID=1120918 RepID=A0A1I1AA01_9FIRM|nr:class I SAM-dependent methyltransferase [Acetitomaculum ruminis]SFB34811.1 Methyltransferase domain-containing protein [Acetitomaculum ruminis DSM 5522]